MKALIGGSLAGSKRVTGLIKLTICMAVIIGLASTGSVSAVPTTTFTLDGSEAWTSTSSGMSLTLTTPIIGTVDFIGLFNSVNIVHEDEDFIDAGASEDAFDIQGSTAGSQWARLDFSFDVISVEFIYGGNFGGISVEAWETYGVGTPLDSFSQASTFVGQLAGPVILSGGGTAIRSLYWKETLAGMDFAAIDNLKITVGVIPAPSALALAGIGVGFVGGLRKRKIA